MEPLSIPLQSLLLPLFRSSRAGRHSVVFSVVNVHVASCRKDVTILFLSEFTKLRYSYSVPLPSPSPSTKRPAIITTTRGRPAPLTCPSGRKSGHSIFFLSLPDTSKAGLWFGLAQLLFSLGAAAAAAAAAHRGML